MNYQTTPSEPESTENSAGIGRESANLTPDIRGNFLSDEELRAAGEELAHRTEAPLPAFQPIDFWRRERDNERVIQTCYAATAHAAKEGHTISPAAEWLLDNHHLVEANVRQVRRDLPVKFYRQLPRTSVLPARGQVPRVLALAWTYVAHTNSNFSGRTVTAITNGFQSAETLKIGELWAIPAFLRFVLLENLRRVSERVQLGRELRHEANELADEMLAAETDEQAKQQFRTQTRQSRRTRFLRSVALPAPRRGRPGADHPAMARERLGRGRVRRRRDADRAAQPGLPVQRHCRQHHPLAAGNRRHGLDQLVRGPFRRSTVGCAPRPISACSIHAPEIATASGSNCSPAGRRPRNSTSPTRSSKWPAKGLTCRTH